MDPFLITMTNQEAERLTIINNLIAKKINGTDAAKQLNLSVRQTKRLKARVIKKGTQGIIHKLRNRESHNQIEKPLLQKATRIIKKNYSDFGPTLATEKLQEGHNLNLGVTTIRKLMIREALWKPKRPKQKVHHRAWRERKACYGEMEQFDGGYHKWFENRNEETCLLAAIDDATGKITKLKFAKNEGVQAVFSFWKEYLETKNKPLAIYLDKFSTYKVNHKHATDNHALLTQFQRACQDLNIQLISAHSPQAKGRVERLFETLQDRLVKELRLEKISDIETANRFLEEKYIQSFNDKFSVVPAKKANLHKPLTKQDQKQLAKIFSIQSHRQVRNDFTLQFKNHWYQLAPVQPTTIFRQDEILIEERLDGSIRLSKKGKYLSFKQLPQRPQKVQSNLVAITPRKSNWIPPEKHPWRNQIKVDIQYALNHKFQQV